MKRMFPNTLRLVVDRCSSSSGVSGPSFLSKAAIQQELRCTINIFNHKLSALPTTQKKEPTGISLQHPDYSKNVDAHHGFVDKWTIHCLSHNEEPGYQTYCSRHLNFYTASLHQAMMSKVCLYGVPFPSIYSHSMKKKKGNTLIQPKWNDRNGKKQMDGLIDWYHKIEKTIQSLSLIYLWKNKRQMYSINPVKSTFKRWSRYGFY